MRRSALFVMLACAGGCAASVNASTRAVDASAADVSPLDAAAPAVDAAPSGPEAVVAGRWRAVRFRSVVNGQLAEFSDATPLDEPSARRVNGVLMIGSGHLRLNVDVFSARGPLPPTTAQGEVPWQPQYLATEGRWRGVAPEFSFEDARAPDAEPLRFFVDDDGLLWLRATAPGLLRATFSIAFARDPDPVRRPRLNTSLTLLWEMPGEIPETFAPVLQWQVPGVERPEQLLQAGPWTGSAPRRTREVVIDLPGGPSTMLQGNVGGIPVAIAFPSAYDDTNRDNRLGPMDGPPLRPTFVVVWRGEGPEAALRGTAFEGILPGYSLTRPQWQREDDDRPPPGLVPYDNTLLPPFSLTSGDVVDPQYRLGFYAR